MKKVGRGSALSRVFALILSSANTAGIYVVFFFVFPAVYTSLGGEMGPHLNPFLWCLIIAVYLFPLYVIFFSNTQMSQAKIWFLNLDDNGIVKTSNKLKLYFKEFGKRELLVTGIPLIVMAIGTILDIKVCGFICIPACVFVDTLPFPIAIVLGWVLFYTEYLLALILRFKKWDKDNLYRQGANI